MYDTSLLEKYCKSLGMTLEKEFKYVPSRRFRADYCILEWRLLIEVVGGIYNGKAHGSITGIKKDIERLNLSTICGWQMIRILPEDFIKTQAIDILETWRKERVANNAN